MPISENWKKSTKSSSGSCVEVRLADGSVQVRDTKLGEESPILPFDLGDWAHFASAVAAGDYDLH